MQCARFSAGECHSCEWLSFILNKSRKTAQLISVLPEDYAFDKLAPVESEDKHSFVIQQNGSQREVEDPSWA